MNVPTISFEVDFSAVSRDIILGHVTIQKLTH